MTLAGVLFLLSFAAASGTGELHVEAEARPLGAGFGKAQVASGTHELGVRIVTETRYRVLPDGGVEIHCAQTAFPTLQGAVRERRLAKSVEEER